jgi:hypothetical protein
VSLRDAAQVRDAQPGLGSARKQVHECQPLALVLLDDHQVLERIEHAVHDRGVAQKGVLPLLSDAVVNPQPVPSSASGGQETGVLQHWFQNLPHDGVEHEARVAVDVQAVRGGRGIGATREGYHLMTARRVVPMLVSTSCEVSDPHVQPHVAEEPAAVEAASTSGICRWPSGSKLQMLPTELKT